MDHSRSSVVSSNGKLPITTFDLTPQEKGGAGTTENRRKSLKLAVQCLIVVILLNISLYIAVRFSSAKTAGVRHCSHEDTTLPFTQSENDQSKFPISLDYGLSSHEYHHQGPAWLLAAAGAQTEKTSISFKDVMGICATFSEHNSPSNCATDTIASVLLFSDSLLSLRSELIDSASPQLSNRRPRKHDSDPSAPLALKFTTPMQFPRAVPHHIAHTIGSSIHHVGYYCPFISTCNNPVFSISTHESIPMVFAFLPSNLGTHTEALKFGFGNATGYHFATNGFATGGFDVLLDRSDTLNLDPKKDYSQMQHEVNCLLSDGLELPGLFFNICNRASEDKGLHGAISPWTRNEQSGIERMKTIIAPDQNMITCAMAIEIRRSMRTQSWIVWGFLLGLTGSGVLLSLFGWWLENRQGKIRL
ncbi:hypothetical protein SBOR_3535 [Sclerotinia borealis F-4128]|uniref:Uncharacterized protein n=1 Tax=Sclerotinia borealis (strain F-4128) TaxID=1432307 RepID=W9CJ73_SCLBF|nr:hypothetical protein SBOR_3535 [Sclerotinia borealis F-4128]